MRKQMFFICIFSLLLVSGVLGASRFYSPYYGGFGGGDLRFYFDIFLNFLEDNQYLLDAIVFLVVFLILVKRSLPKKFEEDKALYIVIGVALTIGIIAYEKNAGYSFIINSGWLAVVVLIGALVFAVTSGKLTGLRLIILSILGFIGLGYSERKYYYIENLIPQFALLLIYLFLFIMLVVGFLRFFGKLKWLVGEDEKEKSEVERLLRAARGSG